MKPLPTQKRALEKRNALLHAAESSFIDHGYENTTAKSIATIAHVATGTFYQYFDNKDDILRVIAKLKRDEIYEAVPAQTAQNVNLQTNTVEENEAINPPTETLFRDVLELIYNYHEEAPELHQVMEQRRHLDIELNQILTRSEDLLEEKVRLFVNSYNPENPEAIAYNLFAMTEGLVHRHVFGNPTTSKSDTLDLGAKMLACYFDCTHST